MRRNAAVVVALAVIVACLSWSWASADGPISGVRVTPIKQHNELEQRVTDLEDRVDALEVEPVPTEEPTPTETPTPTEEPTPTPTEEPSPTSTPTPTPEPEPSGVFPTRSSVGPDVEPTAAYAGDCYFSADESGAEIDGKVLDCDNAGGVRFAVDATGIVFRNSVIRGQMFTVGNTPGDPGADQTRAPVFTVEDSRIIQNATNDNQDRAICCAHYVVKRSLIEGTHSGLAAHNNAVLVGNYITTNGTHSHQSGLRMLKNSTLIGNTVTCKATNTGEQDWGCSAAAVFYRERLDGSPAAAFNLTIEGNYFARSPEGGAWNATRFAGCNTADDCTGISFKDNVFDFGWMTDGDEFPNDAGDVWADNTWIDGQPALSGQSR